MIVFQDQNKKMSCKIEKLLQIQDGDYIGEQAFLQPSQICHYTATVSSREGAILFVANIDSLIKQYP